VKKGEKIFFVVSIVLSVLAIASVIERNMRKDATHSSKDYSEWSAEAEKGYVLYKKSGCNSCHRALRTGEIGVAPVLDGEGTRRSEKWLQAYFKNPQDVVPGTAHIGNFGPDFRPYSEEDKRLLVEFLKVLKSNPGSSNYPKPPFELDKKRSEH
jgi:cbb3-type cytochrome oxidase cytochrome c subunit